MRKISFCDNCGFRFITPSKMSSKWPVYIHWYGCRCGNVVTVQGFTVWGMNEFFELLKTERRVYVQYDPNINSLLALDIDTYVKTTREITGQ